MAAALTLWMQISGSNTKQTRHLLHPSSRWLGVPPPHPPFHHHDTSVHLCVRACPLSSSFVLFPNNTDNDAYTARCTRCVHTMKWYYVHTWPGLLFFFSVLRCCFSHIDRVYTTISMLHLLYDTRITSGFVDLSQTKCARSKWILSYGCPILTFC